MAERIKVALVTNAGGAHVTAYLGGLAATDACSSVVLVDFDGAYDERARKALGNKLTKVYRATGEMLAREKPVMSMVSLEARIAPPVIRTVAAASNHVGSATPTPTRISVDRSGAA